MKYDISERLIWFKGELLHVNDAKINILAPTSQFGLNVFEGIPCYWNKKNKQLYAFRLDDHYNRLIKSARLLQIDCPYNKEQLQDALMEVIRANEYEEDLSVRQTLFVDGFSSWGSDGPTEMFVAPIPRGRIGAEYNKKGLSVCVSSWRRISENTLSPRVKCGANYINSRLGQREALRNGFDTCLFLNEFGKVSEGTGSCFFMIKDEKIITPLLTDSVLESITRNSLIQIAKRNGYEIQERSIDRTELYTADEAFLCGSAMEVKEIVSIDRYELRKGEITEFLRQKYHDAVHGTSQIFQNWITPIYMEPI